MSKYRTDNFLRKKRIKRYVRLALTLSFLIVLLYAVSFWSNHDSLVISEIEVNENRFIETEKVLEIFEESTSSKWVWLVGKRNFVFMPRNMIAQKIEQEVAVSGAIVKTPDVNRVEIEIIEHEPWAKWCDDNQKCYFVNDAGLSFYEMNGFVIEDLVSIQRPIFAEIDGDNLLGRYYADSSVFNKFVLTQELLEKLNFKLFAITTNDEETYTLRLRSGPDLLMSKYNDPVVIINNLQTTIEQESINEVQLQNIEYIDLRFEGKAYYKIK
jgi:hypothetical protein